MIFEKDSWLVSKILTKKKKTRPASQTYASTSRNPPQLTLMTGYHDQVMSSFSYMMYDHKRCYHGQKLKFIKFLLTSKIYYKMDWPCINLPSTHMPDDEEQQMTWLGRCHNNQYPSYHQVCCMSMMPPCQTFRKMSLIYNKHNRSHPLSRKQNYEFYVTKQ